MADYSRMSDAELLAMVQPQAAATDYSKMSDADLLKAVGPQTAASAAPDPFNTPVGADLPKSLAGLSYGELAPAALRGIDSGVRMAANGMTFGMADRFAGGMDALTGRAPSYGEGVKAQHAQTQAIRDAAPIPAAAAEMAGGLLGGAGLLKNGITLAGRAGESLLPRIGAFALEGAGYGAAHGAGNTYSGNPMDYVNAAKSGALTGGLTGGALPVVGAIASPAYRLGASLLGPRVEGASMGASTMLRMAAQADEAGLRGLSTMGPDAMLVDAGPSMLGLGQGAGTGTGAGRSALVDALRTRDAGTGQRLAESLDTNLGPSPIPSRVEAGLGQARQELSPAYQDVLQGAGPVDTRALAAQLDNIAQVERGPARKAAQQVRNMLDRVAPADRQPVAVGSSVPQPAEALAAPQATAAAPKAQSLLEFIASKGGVGPDAELAAIGGHGHTVNIEGVGRRKLVRQGGWPLDYAREAAEEAGYLRGNHNGTSTVNDLLDAMDAEMRGQKRYPEGFEGYVGKREVAARSEREQHEYDAVMRGFDDDLTDAGHGELVPQVKDRAARLMADHGFDADTAVERAFRQLDQEDAAGASGFPGDHISAKNGAPLSVPTGGRSTLEDSPAVLLNTRQAIDGMLATEVDPNTLRILTQARAAVDDGLAAAAPGIKRVDAQFAELSRQSAGLGRGSQVLDTGKTAVRPVELAEEMRQGALPQGEMVGPSAAPARMRQGARAEIDRIVGTNVNDLNALERKIGTPQDWNAQKMATVFGDEPTARVVKSLMDNRRFRQSYQDIVQNSQTAQRVEAAASMRGAEGGNVPHDTTLTGVGLKALNVVAKAISGASNARTKDEIGRILASQGPAAQRIARELLDSAKTTNANAKAISRILSSPGAIYRQTTGEGRK